MANSDHNDAKSIKDAAVIKMHAATLMIAEQLGLDPATLGLPDVWWCCNDYYSLIQLEEAAASVLQAAAARVASDPEWDAGSVPF